MKQLTFFLSTVVLLTLNTHTAIAQSWNGKWKTGVGAIEIKETNNTLYSEFVMVSQTQKEVAKLEAGINGNKATGYIKTQSGTVLYFEWTLTLTDRIKGTCGFTKNYAQSGFAIKFDAVRFINPSKVTFNVTQLK